MALLSNGLAGLTGIPPLDWLPSVSRINGAVWQSAVLGAGTRIRGVPRMRLTLRSAPAAGTLVGYLYDVDGTGTGRLVAAAPVTWTASTTSVETIFPVTAYDVPAGHRLALVLDTKDPLYLDANGFGTALTVADPSWVDVPVR